jgi:hypothetical protein
MLAQWRDKRRLSSASGFAGIKQTSVRTKRPREYIGTASRDMIHNAIADDGKPSHKVIVCRLRQLLTCELAEASRRRSGIFF